MVDDSLWAKIESEVRALNYACIDAPVFYRVCFICGEKWNGDGSSDVTNCIERSPMRHENRDLIMLYLREREAARAARG